MTLRAETVYSDDTDAYVDRQVTDNSGGTLDWTPLVAVDAGPYDVAASWQGDPGPTRTLRVPLVGLAVGTHRLYLNVPGGTNLSLGSVHVTARR